MPKGDFGDSPDLVNRMRMGNGMGNSMRDKIMSHAPANCLVNEEGQLLGKDSLPVNLVVPMPREEKSNLLKDFKESLKPLIIQICEQLTEQAVDPIKRAQRKMESELVISDKRFHAKIELVVKETIE